MAEWEGQGASDPETWGRNPPKKMLLIPLRVHSQLRVSAGTGGRMKRLGVDRGLPL